MQHQMLFLKAMQGADYRFVSGQNPFLILVDGKQYWIFIKNITSAHFTNEDVSRAQLATRDVFAQIKDSDIDFILLGYDQENDVYATWNPLWVKQRLNSRDSLSLYSRFSLQKEAREELSFKRLELSNDGEVVVFPRELIQMFFLNVNSYFLAQGDYVAIGSKRRPEANEAFKTFTDSSNVPELARYLADAGMSQVTIGNYCRVVKTLISDGTITRNRKLFYAYDSLEEYKSAILQFVAIDEVKEKNEKWHNLISAALNAYLDFLIHGAPETTPDTELDLTPEEQQKEDQPQATPDTLNSEPEDVVTNLFAYFCSDGALQKFEQFMAAKGYSQNTVKRYPRAIKSMIQDGTLTKYKDLFEKCSAYREYSPAADEFFEILEVRTINEHKHYENSAAMKQYIAFLSETQAYARNEEPAVVLSDNPGIPYSSQIRPEPVQEPEPVVHDWEAEFTDADGKLTRIANPELIDQLRPHMDTEYPKRVAAFNAIGRFYGDRFPQMGFADWGKLLNAIDWSDPYVHDDPVDKKTVAKPTVSVEPPKRSKTHILRVEFPDGTTIQERVVSETYIAAIKKIDPDLVALVDLSHAGVGVVSKTLDSRYAQYQKPIGGGWYVMTNSSTTTKSEDLQTISDELDLGLKVSLVPIDGSEVTVVSKVSIPEGTRAKIRVTFPDGRVICPSKVLEALIEVVKYAGADRVRALNIICCGDNLILRNPAPRYERPCKPVGNGWLCNTCSDTGTKYAQINEISNRLGLGLKAELI